ncbi:MAG: cystathionine beta-lyase [Betaproteobacteria bacterium RIFCSPLOWO2_02_FULL_62_17]|nr:MAG: cystathionine beta-lyase [Betaproteobacteria bacterium RIFCSPLOWO2_02_FULL_62_17]
MGRKSKDQTRVVHAGRHPEEFHGVVNPPVYHASTVLSPTLADFEQKDRDYAADKPGVYYGRQGTPTLAALEEAIAELEGGYRAMVFPSGLAACACALISCVKAGDHVLISDSAYGPMRRVGWRLLKRFGVEVQFYDPLAGEGIAALMRPNTTAVVVEAPGSLTFEMQDIPAIAAAAHRQGAKIIMDNTWATPLYFKPFAHGVDVSIQAATKYIVGHADAMVGTVTCTKEAWPKLKETHVDLGQTAGPDDVYLAQRGLRTMAVRLAQHWQSGLALAEWFSKRPEVERVLHPAMPDDPGYAIWKRDFLGASGLFSVVLKPVERRAFAAFVDGLELYGIGASWGGYESLIMPFNPSPIRKVSRWPYAGPAFRIHAGLEHIDDLIADLEAGFARLNKA